MGRAIARYKKTIKVQDTRSSREAYLQSNYGMTLAQYEQLYKAQQGKCAACGRRFDKLCVDHSHLSGAVRALLCNACNTTYGRFQEHPKLLEGLLRYAEHWYRHRYVKKQT